MKQGDELPTPEEQRKRVERELAEIERSAAFVRSPVMRRLLRFIVRESEAGRGPLIKSYTVAVDGLGRSEDFDAQQDSYPRVQIGRLRKALESYYRQHQTATGLRFDLRPGSYEIHFVEADSPVGAKTGRGEWVGSVRRKLAGVRTCHAAGTLVIIPALAVITVIAIGAAQGWLSPWEREKAAVVHELRDFPLLDIQPISAQPGSNDGSTANFLTFQMTDAIRRSGWVRVRRRRRQGSGPHGRIQLIINLAAGFTGRAPDSPCWSN